jgi:hypothetical protein
VSHKALPVLSSSGKGMGYKNSVEWQFQKGVLQQIGLHCFGNKSCVIQCCIVTLAALNDYWDGWDHLSYLLTGCGSSYLQS